MTYKIQDNMDGVRPKSRWRARYEVQVQAILAMVKELESEIAADALRIDDIVADALERDDSVLAADALRQDTGLSEADRTRLSLSAHKLFEAILLQLIDPSYETAQRLDAARAVVDPPLGVLDMRCALVEFVLASYDDIDALYLHLQLLSAKHFSKLDKAALGAVVAHIAPRTASGAVPRGLYSAVADLSLRTRWCGDEVTDADRADAATTQGARSKAIERVAKRYQRAYVDGSAREITPS